MTWVTLMVTPSTTMSISRPSADTERRSTVPVAVALPSATSYDTVRPMRAAPWESCAPMVRPRMSRARPVVCSSWENCAIWAMNSVSFIGSRGCWLLICAASSLRKPSLEKMSVCSAGALCPGVIDRKTPVTDAGSVGMR